MPTKSRMALGLFLLAMQASMVCFVLCGTEQATIPHWEFVSAGAIKSMDVTAPLSSPRSDEPLVVSTIATEIVELPPVPVTPHLSIASLPGMADRTITIGSAGKSFSVTGWKTGWVIASPSLTEALWMVHQNVAFSGNTPAQEAIAVGFEQINSGEQKDYFKNMAQEFKVKRDLICQLLKDAGLRPIVPQGSYFVLADFSSVDKSLYYKENDPQSQDYQFARWLLTDVGVAAIPPSVFYSKEHSHLVKNLARFCFCKKEETIREGGKRLLKLNELRGKK